MKNSELAVHVVGAIFDHCNGRAVVVKNAPNVAVCGFNDSSDADSHDFVLSGCVFCCNQCRSRGRTSPVVSAELAQVFYTVAEERQRLLTIIINGAGGRHIAVHTHIAVDGSGCATATA